MRRLLPVNGPHHWIRDGWIRDAAARVPRHRWAVIGGELVAVTAVVALAIAWRSLSGTPHAEAVPPRPAAGQPSPGPAAASEKIMALVNGAEISQSQLAAECLDRHGKTVLEAMVNRLVIAQGCARQGVSVTQQDVDAEIDAMAKRFSVPRDKWIELIEKERGISPRQYAEDIVWPMIALRRLARAAIEPTPDEVREAFENQFGDSVKARIIVARTRKEAEDLRVRALAAPDDFGGLARQHSVDVGSASANGWVQPIRRHSGDVGFERVVFALRPGDVSQVVQVADQFIVVKCEDRLPAADVTLESVQPRLLEDLRERKSRAVSTEVFRGMQDVATVENVLNDTAKAAAAPDVAARVNGQPIMIAEVREKCVDRYGFEVLEILITKQLIEQALKREQRVVAQADIDAEIFRAAESMGFKKPDGSPDVDAWFKRVTQDEKIPLRHYIEDVVQPTVALKQLVGKVPVTQEDLDKAFQATFGPRCRCRLIVLDSQRRAQEVWQLARQNPSAERIGDLAEQYSVDPTSRTLRGEVPPIQQYGGQPALERQAFALKPGELSGIVQVADRFLVIFCEGYTPAAQVTFEEVRGELFDDIHEKKQRIELSRYFTHLRESAAIDNFLAGTSHAPSRPGDPRPVAPGRTLAEPGLPAEAAAVAAQAVRAEPSQPRAGSRKAAAGQASPGQTPPGLAPASQAPAGQAKKGPQPPSGVVPASLDAPIR